jgi:hypothetical protein
MARFEGDNARTRVTILDEDFPGTLGFVETNVTVSKSYKFAEINIDRREGSDGIVTCNVRTEPTEGT